MNRLERIKGCLLGGAVGDALGAPVEFLEWPAIEAKFGPQGIIDFAPAYGNTGAISDETQMMLFTAEGLLRAFVLGSLRQACHVPSIVHQALLRWLMTQDYPSAIPIVTDGWLIKQVELWSRRSPGTTCLNALKAARGWERLPKTTARAAAPWYVLHPVRSLPMHLTTRRSLDA